jgi:ankyrin repeat protein
MSSPRGNPPRNLDQQRKLAKELLKALRDQDPQAIERAAKFHLDPASCKLADAQLILARENSFESWPKLVKQLEQTEKQAFKAAIDSADDQQLRRLLAGSQSLQKIVNDPIASFGMRPICAVAKNLAAVDVLLEFGADINLRSDWHMGPFGILDVCPENNARDLIKRGARLTAHAAARFGWLDELRQIVDADPQVVHEKGGDGQRPLHFAKDIEIADYLLDRGADVNARCVDHQSTAAQYALKDQPDVTRRLLQRGALPDIFMPARLGDLDLARQLIDEDPTCVAARTNVKGYDRVPVMGIYNWVLGFDRSPHEVALQYGHRDVFELLIQHSSPRVRLFDAALRGDESAARAALADDPNLLANLNEKDHSMLATAAFHNRMDAFNLMLKLGFNPMARGIDGGTALHAAAWNGNVQMIQALLQRGVDIHLTDTAHGSTPLGWAAYGSVHCRRPGADYAGAIETLVRAGADPKAAGNKRGATLFGTAAGNPQIQEVLKKLGADAG